MVEVCWAGCLANVTTFVICVYCCFKVCWDYFCPDFSKNVVEFELEEIFNCGDTDLCWLMKYNTSHGFFALFHLFTSNFRVGFFSFWLVFFFSPMCIIILFSYLYFLFKYENIQLKTSNKLHFQKYFFNLGLFCFDLMEKLQIKISMLKYATIRDIYRRLHGIVVFLELAWTPFWYFCFHITF